MMQRNNKKAEMSWAVIVGAVIAIAILVMLLYIAFRGGKLGAEALECEGGPDYCKKTSAECKKLGEDKGADLVLSLKSCKISDEEKGRCCVPSPI
jgi:hypothetical protein